MSLLMRLKSKFSFSNIFTNSIDANIPEVESYQQRFFPEINPNQKNKQILPKPAVNLPQPDVEEVQALKKKKEVV